jgi:hypothetical protein
MKICPSCNRSYTDEALNFCLQDGSPLVNSAPTSETPATARYPAPRITNPPPTEMYRPNPSVQPPPPMGSQGTPYQPQYTPVPQYTPMPVARQPRSNAIWWILGALAVVVVLGIGAVIVIIAVASMNSDSNNNRFVANANSPNRNANAYRPNTNSANTNSIPNLPASFSDDFSSQKWGTGSSAYGTIWYTNDQYHMKSKEKTFLVMYAPNDDYDTENARVRVTAQNVDGVSPASGYGLVVHGASSPEEKLKDYGFLIYTGDNPKYEVVVHRNGTETALVAWAASSIIRGGSNPNQIEVRIKGSQLGFYINGQYATSISDTANFRRGRAGFYTSDVHEVAFDDLQISR